MQSHLLMDPDFFICCICQNEYNQTDRVPKMLPNCGHTFCFTCLGKILENQNRLRCPLDQIVYVTQGNNLDQIPVNIVLKQMVEQRLKIKKDLCQIHEGELRNLVCITDKCRVCKYCVDYGAHKNHEIKYIKDVQSEAEIKREKLQGLLREFDTNTGAINELLRTDKEKATKIVKDRFLALKAILYKQELEVLNRVGALYDSKRNKKVNDETYRNNMEIKKNIEESILALKTMEIDDDFFEAMEAEYESPFKAEYELVKKQSQKLHQNLNEALEAYNDSVSSQILEAKRIEIEFKESKPVNSAIDPYLELIKSSTQFQSRQIPTSFLVGNSSTQLERNRLHSSFKSIADFFQANHQIDHTNIENRNMRLRPFFNFEATQPIMYNSERSFHSFGVYRELQSNNNVKEDDESPSVHSPEIEERLEAWEGQVEEQENHSESECEICTVSDDAVSNNEYSNPPYS